MVGMISVFEMLDMDKYRICVMLCERKDWIFIL